MGTKNGNAAFQRMIEDLLGPVQDCADPFVDDIIIGSGTEDMTEDELIEAHERDLRRVLSELHKHNMVCKPTKASLFVREVEFAGHVVGHGQRRPMPGKLASLHHWEKLQTISELRSFMGFCNYYSGYVRMYAELSGPLQKMLHVGKFDGRKGGEKARLRHTTGLRSTNPMYGVFRAVKPRIGNRCTASGDLCIRISGINRVLFSYCFRQFLRFRSDTHCFDCWRLDRDFTVTASLTVINGNFNAIRHEGSKVARNCMDASAIFIINTRNLNPNFSGCRNRIFDFDIPALDLTSFEWTYVLPYARINFPFLLPSICLKDMGKTKLIREATCEGHISCCLRGMTIRKRGMYSQYSRRNLGSIICLAFPHVRASVMDHGQEGRVCVITLWP